MTDKYDFFSLNTDAFNPDLAGKPLWLLDIDGVINAYSYKSYTPKENAYPDLTRYEVANANNTIYTFWTSPTLISDIVTLHESGKVEIAWLSTWAHDADTQVAPILGLPWFPVAADDGGRRSDYYWKTRAAMEALRLGRPIIWTDDDAITDEAANSYLASDIPHLLVEPLPNSGLTPADLTRIEKFINQHQ